MANYSDIRGYRVKYLSSDPTLNTSTEGQVWYNSTSGTLKSLVQIKAWSAGGTMGTARYGMGPAGSAPQSAALGAGGYSSPGFDNNTEEYNGSSWTAGANLPSVRGYSAGFGIQTAAAVAGGWTSASPPFTYTGATEEYDGSAWTGGGALGTTRFNSAGSGLQTSGLVFGGQPSVPVATTNATEEYNGTAWTAGGNLNTARKTLVGFGTQTASLACGGAPPLTTLGLLTEEYNGTSWTAVNDMVTGIAQFAGTGITTAGLVFGGDDPSPGSTSNKTYEYDGTNWYLNNATLATARRTLSGAGTVKQALAFGGQLTGSTEEYNSSINVNLPGAWASGGTIPSGAFSNSGSARTGTQSSTAIFGGGPTPNQTTFNYDGTTWTASGNRSEGTATGGGGTGTQTAALSIGGYSGPTNVRNVSEEYNGSTWTSGGNLSGSSKYATAGTGSQTAGLATGGNANPPFALTETEEYNGSSWTAGGSLSTGRSGGGGAGTQTATIFTGGTVKNATEEYNGSSWTAGTILNNPRRVKSGGCGLQTAALMISGDDPVSGLTTGIVESWDGSSWTTEADLSTNLGNAGGGFGTNTSAGFARANPSGPNTLTEEFTSPSGVIAQASTLTTS